MNAAANTLRLNPDRSALLVIDFQEKLFQVMPEGLRDGAARAAGNLVFAARALDVPIVVTEQYPKGLGPTLGPVRDELGPDDGEIVEKVDFSCLAAAQFEPAMDRLRGRTVVVAGMETHVCVFQTVRDLLGEGLDVHVAHDAVLSRTEENRGVGLDLCRAAGAHVSGSETVVFDWLGRAGGEVFKAYSRRIR